MASRGTGYGALVETMRKLHLGCGGKHLDGYINIDLYKQTGVDKVMDATDLSLFVNNSVDEIRSEHFIEHFTYHQAAKAFKEWFRVLKPGGLLFIECPDILGYCKRFIDEPENRWCGMPPGNTTPLPEYGHALIQGIFGNQMGPNGPVQYGFGSLPQLAQTHKSGWTVGYLTGWLKNVGFTKFESQSNNDMILRVLAWK